MLSPRRYCFIHHCFDLRELATNWLVESYSFIILRKFFLGPRKALGLTVCGRPWAECDEVPLGVIR